ncbi:MAG: glycoside hydrolase family 47 protein, partial [Sphingobacteriales bacterium]
MTAAVKDSLRASVREAASHAWNGYKKYAAGMDDLQPLSNNGKNWYNVSLLMTPVDAFDSFVMMGLTKEASEAKQMILSSLNFNVDNEVQVFEVTIRLLGGLITAYEMDGDKRFLQLATDLADRLMPAFETKTGMPYRYVHLQTGATRDSINNPAEIGTLLLEFGQLTKHSGDGKYMNAAKKAIMALYARRSAINLIGERINIHTGQWVSARSHMSGYIDSYYEYLHKGWLLFKDADFKKAFRCHNKAIKKHLLSPSANGTFMKVVNMHDGRELATTYGALDAFYAGLCALAGDDRTAAAIQQANYYMWTRFGMEPEEFNFAKDSIISAYYILRPENIESCFYLYRSTKQVKYLQMGARMLNDILQYCRTPEAFAAIKNVTTKEQMNSMQSFFFAETLKYA